MEAYWRVHGWFKCNEDGSSKFNLIIVSQLTSIRVEVKVIVLESLGDAHRINGTLVFIDEKT